MVGTHFVVPKGADDEHVADVGPRQQALEKVEGGRVEPLQVVDEKRERMLRPREHPHEPLQDQLENDAAPRGAAARGPAAALR